ncbi:hypothetical protein [Streptomyces sp. NPDC059015]|uniref:hypothetical protein n=1 Tax=unclassified Streptomyces TaxID=2593676 RepID=UPI0036C362E5
MNTGLHRLTRAGLKQQLDDTRAKLRAEKTTSARLADQIALERQQHAEQLARVQLTADREIRRLTAANHAWQARYANEHAMSDLSTALDDTVPTGIPVVPLPQAIGPVVKIRVPDEATNPAHIPSQREAA